MSNISRERIIETAANLSNKAGLENLSLKMIAEELKIKSPSLYNHVSSLDDIIIKESLQRCFGITNMKVLKKKMQPENYLK